MEREYPAYMAIIPASVRYDPGLKPMEKIMYGEITALAGRHGYCWAGNRYFADIFEREEKTISVWINDLKARGHVRIDFVPDPDNGNGMRRRIWPVFDRGSADELPEETAPEKNGAAGETAPEKNGAADPEKNGAYNRKNDTSRNNTPKAPKGGGAGLNAAAEKRFARFWAAYPKCERKVNRKGAFKAFCRIDPSDELLETMLCALEMQSRSAQWTKDGGSYIPQPTTWLNQERWTAPVASSPPPGAPHPPYRRKVEQW